MRWAVGKQTLFFVAGTVAQNWSTDASSSKDIRMVSLCTGPTGIGSTGTEETRAAL